MLYHGTPQRISMVSWLVPTNPSDLNPNVHEASSKFYKFFSRCFFSDKFGGSLSFLTLGGIPTWKQVTITSPVVFQTFSSGDIQSMDRPNSTKAPHSPHFNSLHPKVELLKGLFSGEYCKKETLCLFMCVCAWTFPIEVKFILFQHITGTVSSEATNDMGYWI